MRPRPWMCSLAYSGIGCPELAAYAILCSMGREVFAFNHGIEKDLVARGVLQAHAFGARVYTDILAWLPPATRTRIEALLISKVRDAIFDRRWKMVLQDQD